MKIRSFKEADRDSVVALWRECGLVAPQNNPVKDIQRKLQVDRDLFLVGVANGKVIASVMGGYEGHRGWINYLAVLPSEQRKGYGQNMMREVESLIRQRGCAKINLQVRAANRSTVAFYSNLGYGDDEVLSLGKRLVQD